MKFATKDEESSAIDLQRIFIIGNLEGQKYQHCDSDAGKTIIVQFFAMHLRTGYCEYHPGYYASLRSTTEGLKETSTTKPQA